MAQPLQALHPKILFVDDEESILSAAKRLFRGKKIDVLTTTSPREALRIITEEDCWVVVSDYRMPEMTGTELLEQVKKKSPQVSRLMLTGFLELPIVQEAINRASVFRFVTKPWDETELLLGIETAIQHAGRQRTNAHLVQEIGIQNQKLEQLTQNLESEVLARTKGIEESKKMAESKQRSVRELTGFVKNLSRVADIPEMYDVLNQEMRKFFGVSTPYLLLLEGADSGKIFWNQSRALHRKTVSSIPDHFHSLSVRPSSEEDRRWWQKQLKKECRQLLITPIRAREAQISKAAAVLFIEHDLESDQLGIFLERMTERLQPVSIVIDKILLKEQLLAATQQWEATFSGFSDPIAVVDNEERVIRANKKFFGAGARCHEMFDNRSDLCVGCPMPNAVLSMEPASNLVRTSKSKTYRVHSYPVRLTSQGLEKVVRVVNHYTDISRERDLYMKLVQSEKLAAVGLLAGNIAHELNNPLSGIGAMAQVIQSEMSGTDPHREDLKEVERAAGRCQQIIRNLLNFSAPSNDQQENADINDIIESTIPLLKTALRTQSFQTFYEKNLPNVLVPPSQLQQVFFNLINNACQAMPGGGVLTIRTWKEGAFVCASVSDTGPGIPEDIQQRIFEPFFTTKEVGLGTGLGLSVSRSIIEKYEGQLKLRSQPGEGTTFTVMLPR